MIIETLAIWTVVLLSGLYIVDHLFHFGIFDKLADKF
jgi:hypothetical protein